MRIKSWNRLRIGVRIGHIGTDADPFYGQRNAVIELRETYRPFGCTHSNVEARYNDFRYFICSTLLWFMRYVLR